MAQFSLKLYGCYVGSRGTPVLALERQSLVRKRRRAWPRPHHPGVPGRAYGCPFPVGPRHCAPLGSRQSLTCLSYGTLHRRVLGIFAHTPNRVLACREWVYVNRSSGPPSRRRVCGAVPVSLYHFAFRVPIRPFLNLDRCICSSVWTMGPSLAEFCRSKLRVSRDVQGRGSARFYLHIRWAR